MARPLRLEYAGAIYHVTSRWDSREPIYDDDDDHSRWLDILSNQYLSGSYTLKETSGNYGKHYTAFSRIVKNIEMRSGKTWPWASNI